MLEIIRGSNGNVMFKSQVEVFDARADELNLKNIDETLVPFCFDPKQIQCYRPSYTKGRTEKLLQTLIEFKSGDGGYVIECTFDKFHEVYMSYK